MVEKKKKKAKWSLVVGRVIDTVSFQPKIRMEIKLISQWDGTVLYEVPGRLEYTMESIQDAKSKFDNEYEVDNNPRNVDVVDAQDFLRLPPTVEFTGNLLEDAVE